MSHAAAWPRRRLSPAGLRVRMRELHQPKVLLFNTGWLCVAAALALSILGVSAIGTTEPAYALRHAVHLAMGIVAAVIVAVPHFRSIRWLSYPLLLLVTGLLVFVLIPFVPEAIVRPRNGARRWINMVVMDVQPSELAKIAYVLALANYLRFRTSYRTLPGLLLPLVLTFIPMGLILVEPDLGTAMLFLPTLFAMLVAAGAKLRHLVIVMVLGLSAAPLMYPMLRPHQKDRIEALYYQFIGDSRHENDIGYQGARAMTLVGSGRLVGVGKAHAEELVTWNHLPEDHNDMIFAVIACRWGALGAVTTWGLFLLMCGGGLLIAATCKDPFGRLVAVGVSSLLFAQMAINTGMTIGLMPITGMTLPFVSSGGSSLIATWIMIGLLLNVAMRRAPYMARRSFEFDEEDNPIH
ncbi:MAG: FtsW/RodA/SpoVE family cell cycle protein [Planctomycetota bacterium]